MSRRKQLHPKSPKDGDAVRLVLPAELKYDEKTNTIITGVNLASDHRFGSFAASFQIEDRIEVFQLLNIKDNWLAYCSVLNQSSANLNLIFHDKQLTVMVKESIAIGTRLHSNQLILPRVNMTEEIPIKAEPIETEMSKSSASASLCNTCGVRFSNRNTLDIHREHYSIEYDTRTSHSIESTIVTRVKRKLPNHFLTIPVKRALKEDYSSECDTSFPESDQFIRHREENFNFCQLKKKANQTIPLTRPIQLGQFMYIPIPVVSSQLGNKPLDLSKPTKRTLSNKIQLYQCKFCSIHFRSFETLQAHQENYCLEYEQRKSNRTNPSPLFTCRSCKYRGHTLLESNVPIPSNPFLPKCIICSAMFDNEEILLNHIKCVHTNARLIECLECQSRFRSKWNLIRHMKLLHTNIKCDEKEKNRKSSDSINHNNGKYSCPSCYTRFSQLTTLTQHMSKFCSSQLVLINERMSDITYCSTCDISFQHRTSFEAHKMYYCRDERQIGSI